MTRCDTCHSYGELIDPCPCCDRPATLCGAEVRGAGGIRCRLRPGHAGAHSSVVAFCDSCGEPRRRSQVRLAGVRGYDGDIEDVVGICFACERGIPQARWRRPMKMASG